MDPASVLALIEGSVSLALQCGGVAKTLSDLAGRYKSSDLTILSMAQSLDIMQLAWSRIKDWSQAQWYSLHLNSEDDSFSQRLIRSLEIGKKVMDVLQDDLRPYRNEIDTLNFKQRSKAVWNQDGLGVHRDRIRDQAASMTLLLQALQLKSPAAREELLREAGPTLRKSDESAATVVPSEPSHFSISTHESNTLGIFRNSGLIYEPLSFEDELFTADVYKRTYRRSFLTHLFGLKDPILGAARTKVASMASREVTEMSTGGIHGRFRYSKQRKPLMQDTSLPIWPLTQEAHLTVEGKPGSQINDHRGGEEPEAIPKLLTVMMRYGCSPEGPLKLTDWNTPPTDLIKACMGDHKYVARTVSKSEGDMHTKYRSACGGVFLKAIHVATIHDKFKAVKYLLDCGADINDAVEPREGQSIYAGWCPLHLAVRRGHSSIVELLLQRGANVIARSSHGYQPIHVWAANCERLDILRLLMEHSAHINARDHDESPLTLARTYGRVDIARDFFQWGVEVDWEPLMKSPLVTAHRSQSALAMHDRFAQTIEPNTQKRRYEPEALQLFNLTIDDDDGAPLWLLDIEFFRLFLTFNAYEDARHQVTYHIVSRWCMESSSITTSMIDMLQACPERLRLRELVATFDGTAQVYKGIEPPLEPCSIQEMGDTIDTLCFSVSREERKTHMVAMLWDPHLQRHGIDPIIPC